MPVFEIQGPDGKTYEADAPDAATAAKAFAPKQQAAPADEPSFVMKALHMLGGVGDAGVAAASGAIAKPMSDLSGLGAIANNALGLQNIDPASAKARMQAALTYQPRTKEGSQILQGVGNVADSTLGAAGRFFGQSGADDAKLLGAGDSTQDAVRNGVTEAVNQAPNFLGAKVGEALTPADLPAAVAKPSPSLINQTLKDARASGAVVTPEYSKSAGGTGGGTTGTVASLSGSEVKMQQTLSKYNSRVWAPKVAAEEVGLPPGTPLTPAALDQASTEASGAYTAAGRVGNLTPDAQLATELKKISVRNDAVDAQFGSDQGPQIQALQAKYSPKANPDYYGPQTDLVRATGEPGGAGRMPGAQTLKVRGTLSAADPRASVIGQGDLFQLQNPPRPGIVQQDFMFGAGKGRAPSQGPLGQQTDLLGTSQDTSATTAYQPMNSEAVVQAVRDLRADARSLYKQTDNPEALRMADATRKAADALDDFVQRQLKTPVDKGGKGLPNLADALTASRTRLAKIASVRDALNPATGSIDGSSLATDLDNGVPLSGGLKTIAMTSKAFPKVMQVPERLPASSGPTVLEQGGAVTALLHGNVPAALAMFARPIARARVGMQDFQNRMVNGPAPAAPRPPGAIAAAPLAQPTLGQPPAQQQPGQQ
jgi:hypothetical protein